MPATVATNKPILCIDFDGVIHSYEHGWRGGVIYGTLVPGFVEWADQARKHFNLVIYSSRSRDFQGTMQMAHWLALQMELRHATWQCTDLPTKDHPVLRFLDAGRAEVLMFSFAHEKPKAFLTIDDRGIHFAGKWDAEYLRPENLLTFKPWNN